MSTALVWFRRDLRLADNPAFFEACTNHDTVIPIYILDDHSVLGEAQAWWLHHSLNALNHSLTTQLKLALTLRKGAPLNIILDLVKTAEVDAIYWNRCYEPKSIQRDKKIKATLQKSGVDVFSFNGSLFNEPWTISTKSGDFLYKFGELHLPQETKLFKLSFSNREELSDEQERGVLGGNNKVV